MHVEGIPLVPPPLGGAQAEAMAQRQIKKHHVAIMLLHWFNAAVWLLELATGAALILAPAFRVAPLWYIRMVETLFGTRGNLLRFHIAVGVTWTVVFLVYGTFGFRTYLGREVLQKEMGLDRDDLRWLLIRGLRMLGWSREPLPPQGIYNAGQKLFAFLVYLMIPLVMLSGLILAFHLFGTGVVAWAAVIHFAAVGMVVSGLMIHVYMGAVFPEEKAAFFSMITGMVSELYAYRHHFTWWREVKTAEHRWRAEMDGVPAGAESTAPGGPGPEDDGGASPGKEPAEARDPAPILARAFRRPEYWPPYVAGTLLGLTLLTAFVLMGEGLGASGGFTRYLVAAIAALAPRYAASSPYWSAYLEPGQSPLLSFLVLLLLGAAIGGFVSAALAGRLRLAVDKGPRTATPTRLLLAVGGGILTGFGARLARGCTSGLALSGGALLSVGAFVFMLSVFAAGFVGAYVVRRYWL